MNEPNEITEIIINELGRIHLSHKIGYNALRSIVISKINIDHVIFNDHLSLLSRYKVAHSNIENGSQYIEKLENFGDVVNTGGLKKYIEKQKYKSEQEKRFKELQLEEQEIKNQYIERQYKMQHRYFILALVISSLALCMSFLAYLKK